MGDDREIVRTHVGVYDDQKAWANENHINLSSLLREAIEERRDA